MIGKLKCASINRKRPMKRISLFYRINKWWQNNKRHKFKENRQSVLSVQMKLQLVKKLGFPKFNNS